MTEGPGREAETGLLSVREVVIREQNPAPGRGSYLFGTPQGRPLGTMERDGPDDPDGRPGPASWTLVDAEALPVARLELGRAGAPARFTVIDAAGSTIGTLHEGGGLLTNSRITIHVDDRRWARLTGGGFGGDGPWTLVGTGGARLALMRKVRGGEGLFFSGNDSYRVRPAAQVTGRSRLLALLAVVALDIVGDVQEHDWRRSRTLGR